MAQNDPQVMPELISAEALARRLRMLRAAYKLRGDLLHARWSDNLPPTAVEGKTAERGPSWIGSAGRSSSSISLATPSSSRPRGPDS